MRGINCRKYVLKSWNFLLYCTFLGISTSYASADELMGRQIIPEIGMSVICLKDPLEVGWREVIPERPRADNQYRIYVRSDLADGDALNIGEQHTYRLSTIGHPCYYEYRSFGGPAIGTNIETSGTLGETMIEGSLFPNILPEKQLSSIVTKLVGDCRGATYGAKSWPFRPNISCQEQVLDILLLNTTQVHIANEPNLEFFDYQTVVFVLGQPFYQGREIDLW